MSPDADIIALREEGLSFADIGLRLGLSKDKVQKRWLRHLRPVIDIAPVEPVEGLVLTDYVKLVERTEGDAVVVACCHFPEVDETIWTRMLGLAQRDGIGQLIVAGDIVAGDMFSRWLAMGQIPEWSFDAEMENLRRHISQALTIFERIVILPGNHVGNRIKRVTGGHIGLEKMMRMAGLSDAERARIVTTELDYIDHRSGGERFLIAHSSNYSKIDGRVPVWYAEKEECHVIAGNGHRTGHQVSRSGRWHGWDIGTMANPAFMGYANAALTTFPKMLQSFAVVRSGAVRIYGSDKPLTDWQAELG